MQHINQQFKTKNGWTDIEGCVHSNKIQLFALVWCDTPYVLTRKQELNQNCNRRKAIHYHKLQNLAMPFFSIYISVALSGMCTNKSIKKIPLLIKSWDFSAILIMQYCPIHLLVHARHLDSIEGKENQDFIKPTRYRQERNLSIFNLHHLLIVPS